MCLSRLVVCVSLNSNYPYENTGYDARSAQVYTLFIQTKKQKTTRISHSMRRLCVKCVRKSAYVLNVPAEAPVRIMCDCSPSFARLISQRAVIIRFSSYLFRHSVSRTCCVRNAHPSPVWYGNLSSRELKCLRNTIHGNLFITYILSVTLWMLTLTLQVSVQRTT